jgi:hypothetical protein
VARLSVAAGYDVVLSNSRGPHALTDLVQELSALLTEGVSSAGRRLWARVFRLVEAELFRRREFDGGN